MSCAAIDHVWSAKGVTAEEKLVLLWLANASGGLGQPVCPDWITLGEFVGIHYEEACNATYSLIDKGLVKQGDEEGQAHCFWLVYDGPCEPPIDWMAETRSRSKRVAALIERDGPQCSYCDRTPVLYEVDHFVPSSKGGEDKMSNLVLACAPCNRAKRDKLPEEFLRNDPRRFEVISTNLKYLHAPLVHE